MCFSRPKFEKIIALFFAHTFFILLGNKGILSQSIKKVKTFLQHLRTDIN